MSEDDDEKLKALARLPRRAPVKADMDDLVFGSMSKTMRILNAIHGAAGWDMSTTKWVAPDESSSIQMERDEGADWRERLHSIWQAAHTIAPSEEAARSYARGIMEADGWVVARGKMRSPVWMDEISEFDVREVAKMEGFGWLEDGE